VAGPRCLSVSRTDTCTLAGLQYSTQVGHNQSKGEEHKKTKNRNRISDQLQTVELEITQRKQQ